MGVSYPLNNKAICSFISTFPLIASSLVFEYERRNDIQCVKLVQILSSGVLIWVCLYYPAIRQFLHFFCIFPLIAGYWDFEYERQCDIQVCEVSTNTIVSCFDIGVSFPPSNKAMCSFLVHFPLLLAVETLNVKDDMIFKCVKLVQILSSVVLIRVCLSHPEIRPFVHF